MSPKEIRFQSQACSIRGEHREKKGQRKETRSIGRVIGANISPRQRDIDQGHETEPESGGSILTG